MMETFKEIYKYRAMVSSLVKRDLRGRYKGSALGFLWTFLNPLLQLCVYTVVFSIIMKNGIKDYYLFLFVALIPWIMFSSSISTGCKCIVSQASMVNKIYFPREVLPISFVTTQFVNMLLSFIVVFAVLIFSGKGINPAAIIYLPLIMVIEYALALGLTMFFSAVTVYLRDMEYILGIVSMIWQFMTPVMYSVDQVPDRLRPIFYLNPMTAVISAYRDILYYKQAPQLFTLINAVVMGIFMLIFGFIVFKKLERHFAERL